MKVRAAGKAKQGLQHTHHRYLQLMGSCDTPTKKRSERKSDFLKLFFSATALELNVRDSVHTGIELLRYCARLRREAAWQVPVVVTDTHWACNPTYTTEVLSRSPATWIRCSSVQSHPSFMQVGGWLELFQPRHKGSHLQSRARQLFDSMSTPLQERGEGKYHIP